MQVQVLTNESLLVRLLQVLAGADSVFTPIGVWVRDANMHQLLKGLKAFDQLWLGNSLRKWVSAKA